MPGETQSVNSFIFPFIDRLIYPYFNCLFVSRGGILDTPVCLNAGGRYFVDVIFNEQPGSSGPPGSHILIDSVRKSSSVHLPKPLRQTAVPSWSESIQKHTKRREMRTFRHFLNVYKCTELAFQMGLIPRIESVQDFCSQNDLDSFRRFRCIGLAADLSPHESLPEVCEGLVNSMSARIHNGAVRKWLDDRSRRTV